MPKTIINGMNIFIPSIRLNENLTVNCFAGARVRPQVLEALELGGKSVNLKPARRRHDLPLPLAPAGWHDQLKLLRGGQL